MIKDKLLELIKNNPDLDVLFFANTEDINDDFSYTAYTNLSVDIEELTLYNDEIWLDYDDVKDRVSDKLTCYDKYTDLSDEEFDKIVKYYIKENYIFKKYICVWGR